jgi:hypothetical protein
VGEARGFDELPDRLEDRPEVAIVFLLECVDPRRQLGVGREHRSQPDEGAHDLHIHCNGPRALEHAR